MSEHEKRLKALQMAQAALVEETTARFNESYQQWKASGTTQPIPLPTATPSESEVVARALEFYNAGNAPVTPLLEEVGDTEEENEVTAEIAATGDPMIENIIVPVDDRLEPIRKIFSAPSPSITNIMSDWVYQTRTQQSA